MLPSSSIYSTATGTSMKSTVSTPVVTTSQSNTPILVSSTTTTSTVSTSMNSTVSTPVPTSQSTVSNTLMIAAVISTVFILLVVTILVILIVSVLVYRRRWYKTSSGNDTFNSDERKSDIDKQSHGNVYWTRPHFA